MHDLIITNGTVFDGTGKERFVADIAVNDERITEIGDLSDDEARRVIDAKGKYVMPGFIDIANRSDVYWRLFVDPQIESHLRQGITTIIGGNSGSSLAPLFNESMFLSTQKWSEIRGTNVSWQTMDDFLRTIQQTRLATNFGTFVGHGTLRRGIVGDEHRALTEEELTKLLSDVASALNDGALGVSLGLVYEHARSATEDELIAIAQVVAQHNKLFAVHLRDEEQNVVEALQDVILIARETGVRLHVTHLKAVGKPVWRLMREALIAIEAARAEGLDVSFDVYPYTATGSVLYTFVPSWLSEGGKTMLLTRLANENLFTRAAQEITESRAYLADAIVSQCANNDAVVGKSIGELARRQDRTLGEIVLSLLSAAEGRVLIILEALSEENVTRAITHPFSLITSNSPGISLTEESAHEVYHPRSFGAFPRLFHRYVVQQDKLSWELAVHKSSGKVARTLGMTDRGFLQEGLHADIVIVDPREFRDYAVIGKPAEYAGGVEYLIVNGVVTIDDGQLTGIRAGAIATI